MLFSRPSHKGDAWFFAGLASSFPNLTESGNHVLNENQPCRNDESSLPGCKVFHVPPRDASEADEIKGDDMISHYGISLQDQVLIFQYKGKFHAIDNRCPHSAYPLAKGTPFDIEDFGVVLSAGITCPKHGWSFDLFTGHADRSSYMLRRWEVELRPVRDDATEAGGDGTQKKDKDEQEVWVRRKQRIG